MSRTLVHRPHRLLIAAAAATLVVAAALPLRAAQADGAPLATGDHPKLGVILARLAQARPDLGFGNLRNHGGPVMHTNTTYAIYWVPTGYTVSTNYRSLIDGFFANVAADSGKTSNVYYSDTQYRDNSGLISYSSAFGGSVVDTNALPASGCTDSSTSVCVTDAQIQTEIQHVMTQQHWVAGPTTAVFMFTAKGVGSCMGASSGASNCSFTGYCAYHSWIGSGPSAVLYANMPYAMTVPSACSASSGPNGDDADATLNVTSHEHNETITDPQGTAWWDLLGYENGDKCAWKFGASLGSTASGPYNQVIGTGKYLLQQEWSNYSARCVLTGK